MTAVAVSFWPVGDVARTRIVCVPGEFQIPVQVGPPGVKVPVPGSHSKVTGLPLRDVDAAAESSTLCPVRTWELGGEIRAVARSWSVDAWTEAATGLPPQSLYAVTAKVYSVSAFSRGTMQEFVLVEHVLPLGSATTLKDSCEPPGGVLAGVQLI